MKSKWLNVLFALLWAAPIIGMAIYASSLYDNNLDTQYKINTLLVQKSQDSVEINLLKNSRDTVRITTTTSYSFEMDGKKYSTDEYIELFNRIYNENRHRQDSLQVFKHNLNLYKSRSEDYKKLYSDMVDSANVYIKDLNYYKIKYEDLREYLKNGKVLFMKGDTLRVTNKEGYLNETQK